MDLPTIALPLYYILAGVFVIIIETMVFFLYLMDVKKFAPEAKVFIKARKKGLPVLCLTDIGSGYSELLPGIKEEPRDIAFKDDNHPGMHVDPSLLGEADALHFVRGLDMYFYASTQWMPLNTINALGFKTVKRLLNERYLDLGFLPPQEVAELLYTKSQELVEDCTTVVKKYAPNLLDPETGVPYQDEKGNSIKMTGYQLATIITDFREELKETKTDTGFYSFQAAFLMNPISHLSQDLEQLKMLIELMLRAEYEKIMKLLPYVIMGLMIMGGVTLMVVILYNTIFK